jgi:hypothetical protein
MLLLMVKPSMRDIELFIETQTADTLLRSNIPSRHYVKQSTVGQALLNPRAES